MSPVQICHKGSRPYSFVRPRPCSSTCRWTRCATHRQKCSDAHFGRVPAAPCITAEGSGRFLGPAWAAGLDICSTPPHLGAFQFTFGTVSLYCCHSRILVPPRQAHHQNTDFSFFFGFADPNRSSRATECACGGRGSQFVGCNEPSGSQVFGHEKASASQFLGHKKGQRQSGHWPPLKLKDQLQCFCVCVRIWFFFSSQCMCAVRLLLAFE